MNVDKETYNAINGIVDEIEVTPAVTWNSR
jgi:hypothetical protein